MGHTKEFYSPLNSSLHNVDHIQTSVGYFLYLTTLASRKILGIATYRNAPYQQYTLYIYLVYIINIYLLHIKYICNEFMLGI